MSPFRVSHQGFNHIANDVIVNCGECFKDAFALYGTSVAKDYFENRVELHVRLVAWVNENRAVPQYYCLRLNKYVIHIDDIAEF